MEENKFETQWAKTKQTKKERKKHTSDSSRMSNVTLYLKILEKT